MLIILILTVVVVLLATRKPVQSLHCPTSHGTTFGCSRGVCARTYVVWRSQATKFTTLQLIFLHLNTTNFHFIPLPLISSSRVLISYVQMVNRKPWCKYPKCTFSQIEKVAFKILEEVNLNNFLSIRATAKVLMNEL